MKNLKMKIDKVPNFEAFFLDINLLENIEKY